MLGPCLIVEIEMAKQRDAAMFDLFDQAAAKSQIGERQSDLEDLIAASEAGDEGDAFSKAFDELEDIGAPVIINSDGYFISGEENYDEIWADYYCEFGGPGLDDFGVSEKINAILSKYGLFAEWKNPGCLGVYYA